MNKFWRFFVYIGLPIAVIGTIISISVVFRRTSELQFDYMGVIVGILSALVTVLIGWNIYRVLEDREKIKKEVLEEVNKELVKSQYRFYKSFITEEITLANIYMKSNDWNNTLLFLSLMGKRYKWIADDFDNNVDISGYICAVAEFIECINGDFIHDGGLSSFMSVTFYDLAKYNKKVVDVYMVYKEKSNKTPKRIQLMNITSNETK